MRMCVETSFHSITDERWCVSFSLSLSLSLFVKNLCFVFGVEDFCFARVVVVSSPKSVGTVVSLFWILKPYTTSSRREREKERGGYITVFYTMYVMTSLCVVVVVHRRRRRRRF